MDLEQRLEMAQTINKILKQKFIIKPPSAKVNSEIINEVNVFMKTQLNNLLLNIMGERNLTQFNEEEILTLKQFVNKIKQTTTVKHEE